MEIALLLTVVFFALVGTAVWFAMRDPPAAKAPPAPPPKKAAAPTPEPPPRARTLFDLAESGEADDVKRLIEENPERLNLRDASGWTVLHHAAYGDQPALIDLLLSKGADANAVAEGECAPIHMVATDGGPDALSRLIAGGAHISFPDDTGATALHFATLNRRLEMVQALIEAGAPTNMKDAQQETAFDLAKRLGHAEMMAVIEAGGGKSGSEVRMKDVLEGLPEDAVARRMVPRAWHLDVEDPRFQASVEQAKAGLPKFLEQMQQAEDPHAAVKFAVRGEGVIEYVWGEVLEASSPMKVAFLTPPVAVTLQSDTTEVPHDEVVDWQLELDDDRTAGGYGQRATFEAIREEYGFLPSDIEKELSNLVDL